jgi:cysteine synthase
MANRPRTSDHRPEIWEQMDGAGDAIVAGHRLGGTIPRASAAI